MITTNNNLKIEEIKQEIEKLKGQKVNLLVNQGRKKYSNFEGIIEDAYKSIFVVRLQQDCAKTNNAIKELQTYSYTDILCGNVDIDATSFSKRAVR